MEVEIVPFIDKNVKKSDVLPQRSNGIQIIHRTGWDDYLHVKCTNFSSNIDYILRKFNKQHTESYTPQRYWSLSSSFSIRRTSLFIIMSFIYAKLLVVVCIAYVISEVVTLRLPMYYYEGFFTYLYGASILFLLYVFCFLLQESACCARGDTPPPPPRPPKAGWVAKESKDKKKDKKEKDKKDKDKKDKDKDQKAPKNKKEPPPAQVI